VPDDVRAYYQHLAKRSHIDSECVVMAPGSSWSESAGFRLVPFDYSKREEHIETMRLGHDKALLSQYAKEDLTLADYAAFRSYFLGLIHAVPWVIRRWLKLRIIFRIRDPHGEHNWLVDFVRAKVEETLALDQGPLIEVAALVLNDCTNVRMFSVWTASKRLRIRLPTRAHLRALGVFFLLLDLYELEVLPLRKNFSGRAIAVRLRRWREVVEMGRMFLKHVVLRRPIDIAGLYSLPVTQHP
jgi:hypothetical protein